MVLSKFKVINAIFFCLGIFIAYPYISRGEGTKELEPTNDSYSKFQAGDDKVKNYAVYSSPKEKRLYIHIEDASSEIVYFGFGYTFWDNDKLVGIPCSYRIKDPNNNIVVQETSVPDTGAGYINSREEAIIGPNNLNGGAGGYSPLSFKLTIAGDYYMEFNFDTLASKKVRFDYLDITVAKNNIAIKGRLWSYMWSLSTLTPTNPSFSKFFIYTEDSTVTSLDLNGMQPLSFSLMCNRMGTNVSTDFLQSRKSIMDQNGQYLYPQFKIFLNDPDNAAYPSFSNSTTIKSVKINNCSSGMQCKGLSIDLDHEGLVELYLDLDSNTIYSPNSPDVMITKFLNKGLNCIPWDGKDGQGKDVKTGTIVKIYTSLLKGLINFPINDSENNVNGIKVELIRPNLNFPSPADPIALSYDDSKVGGITEMNCEGACHKWSNNFGDNITMNTWWHIQNIQEIDSILFVPCGLTSLAEKESSTVRFYPNPTKDVLNISTTAEINIKIFNSLGSTVYVSTLSLGINAISLTSFEQGLYFIVLESNGKVYYQSLIKE